MTIKNRSKNNAFRLTRGDKLFVGLIYFMLVIVGLVLLIPMLNVIVSSFSSPKAVGAGKVTIFPMVLTLKHIKWFLQTESLCSALPTR